MQLFLRSFAPCTCICIRVVQAERLAKMIYAAPLSDLTDTTTTDQAWQHAASAVTRALQQDRVVLIDIPDTSAMALQVACSVSPVAVLHRSCAATLLSNARGLEQRTCRLTGMVTTGFPRTQGLCLGCKELVSTGAPQGDAGGYQLRQQWLRQKTLLDFRAGQATELPPQTASWAPRVRFIDTLLANGTLRFRGAATMAVWLN